jgi:hypothetical protein
MPAQHALHARGQDVSHMRLTMRASNPKSHSQGPPQLAVVYGASTAWPLAHLPNAASHGCDSL